VSDRAFAAQALALAALGEGMTRPNPAVGCVVVRDGTVVGRGYHRAAGSPHAEASALAEAGERARGATLYVSLEPCAHHGRTPPCVAAIVHAGIARVVASVRDPNPLVDGRGIAALADAGVAVDLGILEDEARELNAPFFSFHRRGRPWVTVKAAASLDGRISAQGGSATWITGEPARRFAHRLRFVNDAVLVGAATVRRDDPQLTVRLAGLAARRLRAVIAPSLRLDPHARVFARDDPSSPLTCVYAGAGADRAAEASLAGVAEIVRVPEGPEGLDLAAVVSDLARRGVQSLLVEGGGRTFASFVDAGLADAVALFIAPTFLGAHGATPVLDRPAFDAPDRGWRLHLRHHVPLGPDRLVLGTRDRG
jgi:diaminohydroxyphosphoribosylaminopyrimidine deaminase / 5-amino-6-(5-phosphoribosylamino)uracil reductase